MKPGAAGSVAVSQDAKTVYVTGCAGGFPYSVFTVAYQATGAAKWATRYKDAYGDGHAFGSQIVAGPGGNAVYVVGTASSKSGHNDITTLAYRAATGKELWPERYDAHGGGSQIAVTPDGQTVIVTGGLTNGLPGYEALVSYNASTGETQWTATPGAEPIGLVIDPRRKMVFVGGNRTVGYSVAHGTVLWTASWAHGSPTAIGLSADGTRLFETGWNGGGSTTVAYHT